MTPYRQNRGGSIFSGVDWITILIYFMLVIAGWITIFAAVFSPEHSNIFDISMQYGAQMIWIGVSFFVALMLMLVDDQYIYTLSYPLYGLTILTLIAVLVFGTEVNGARSWFQLGPFRLQPAEFAKFSTGLALARYISNYQFNIHKFKDIALVFAIAMLPAMIIILQNDTGSALVYSSFLIMFYREGFASWVYVALIIVISIAVGSFIFESWLILLVLMLLLFVLMALDDIKMWMREVSYLAAVLLGWLTILLIDNIFIDGDIGVDYALFTSFLLFSPLPLYHAIKNKRYNIVGYISLFFVSIVMLFSVDYIFNNMMKIHQQKRILDTLGIENDTRGWGYNVNQSKIAIGSGGLFGKGYLNGTQTKYDFVPEQSTDFIFCTIGEEWGFIGSAVIIILFITLIIRLMRMGDNQKEAFGRIYCYFVASVLSFHVVVNIGMTIGLMPVIGIPLPFFSYGGSSLIAFTTLLFIAIRLDSRNNEHREI